MFGLLLGLLIVDGLLLIVIVLLQAGKGGGLAAMGGGSGGMGMDTSSFVGGRQAATLLTRSTWILGGIFLFLALTLSILSSSPAGDQPESILREEFEQTAPAQPEPVLPGTEGQQQDGAAPEEIPVPGTEPAPEGTQQP